jgi:hypothetical protein
MPKTTFILPELLLNIRTRHSFLSIPAAIAQGSGQHIQASIVFWRSKAEQVRQPRV